MPEIHFIQQKEKNMRIYSLVVLFLFSALFLFNCQNNTTDKGGTLDVEDVVAEQAAFGFQINDIASTSGEIEEINSDPMDVNTDAGIGGKASLNALKARALNAAQTLKAMQLEIPSLAKTAGDSVLFGGSDTLANGKIVRWGVYYDFFTGKARWVSVTYNYPELQNLNYDSLEIVMDMGIPYGTGSENVESLFEQQLFKDSFFIEKIESEIAFSDYTNGKPGALTATRETHYRPGRELSWKKMVAAMNADGSGTIAKEFHFSDGSSSSASFTYNAEHTGSFTKTRRDGTVVSGTFDQVSDDGSGSYSSLIDFPTGYYLDKIEKEATMSLADHILTVFFAQKIFFSTGEIDSSNSTVTVEETESGTVTTITAQKRNGAHGTLTFLETDDGTSTMEGVWTTWDGYYILLNAEYYMDGSSHMHYDVYTNEASYNNGDDPIVTADYDFTGETGGEGTLTYNGTEYQVTFDGSGKGEISDGSNTKTINLYF